MNWLQIRLFGPYFSSFLTNSYSYYSQTSQNLVSNIQIFASALIVRQTASSTDSPTVDHRLCTENLLIKSCLLPPHLPLTAFFRTMSRIRFNNSCD